MLETVKKMMTDSIVSKRAELTAIKDELDLKRKRIEALFQKRTDKLLLQEKEIQVQITGLEKDLADLEALSKEMAKQK